MDEGWHYQRIIMLIIIILALIVSGALLAVFPGRWGYALGMVWGSLGGLVGYRIKVLAIYRFLQGLAPTPSSAGFKWYLAVGLTMGLAVAANKISGQLLVSPYTVVAGLFLPNLVLIADGFLRRPAPMPENVADGAATKEDAGEA